MRQPNFPNSSPTEIIRAKEKKNITRNTSIPKIATLHPKRMMAKYA